MGGNTRRPRSIQRREEYPMKPQAGGQYRKPWTKHQPTRLTELQVVAVCAACKRASCWQNVFPCESPGRRLALPRSTLEYLDREMDVYWTAEWQEAARIYKGATT